MLLPGSLGFGERVLVLPMGWKDGGLSGGSCVLRDWPEAVPLVGKGGAHL